jgi:hypothetical protein
MAIMTEITWSSEIKNNLKYVGIVGSVARIFKTKSPEKNLYEPGDLDIVILCNNFSELFLNTIFNTVEDVCKVYSFKTDQKELRLVPQYSSSPAKDISHPSDVPIQILMHDDTTIQEKWMPYIYHDRSRWHLDLFGSFPAIKFLSKFKMEEVIKGDDGIKECINALKTRISPGYRWAVTDGKIYPENAPIKLDSTEKMYNYLHYTLYWSLLNIAQADDSIFKVRNLSDINKIVRKINPSLTQPSTDILNFLLKKEYKDSKKHQWDKCRSEVIKLLNELICKIEYYDN